jgi:ParB/RepB/Spo0J family partition protein
MIPRWSTPKSAAPPPSDPFVSREEGVRALFFHIRSPLMTTGNFETILLDSITIDRTNRQRKELVGLEELAASIREVGLINPPVVTRGLQLIAGERRLEACRSLGWSSLPVQYADTLDPTELYLIELEENVKRVDLSWQDHNDAIAAYHRLKGFTPAQTAKALGLDDTTVNRHLAVAEARARGVSGVEDAPVFSVARGITIRNTERQKTEALSEIKAPQLFPELKPLPARPVEYLNESFLVWSKKPQPRRFNLIHCDFPYGRNTGSKIGMSAAKGTGTYADTADIYFELLSALIGNAKNFLEPSAHLVFWFAMDYYTETKALLEKGGWSVNPYPLIWHKSDNAGILSDKDRQPRRIYETAFLASQGDRKIVRAVSNVYSGPTTREHHTSEKPKALLSHFFRMLVDESTYLLDPTAGSANALSVAESAGAAYALGTELSHEFWQEGKRNLGL